MKGVFLEILEQPLPDVVHILPRLKSLPDTKLNKVFTVIGPRRSGKSSLLLNEMSRLLSAGVDREKIVWVNLEDDRINWELAKPDDLLQAREQMFPDVPLKECYFFLDEVQNAVNWEKFVRRLHDTPCKLVAITGSNSKLLATEVHTSLRGRGWPVEILPLSFKEYLTFSNTPVRQRAAVLAAFYRYMQQGGFVDTVSLNKTDGAIILQDYYNVMLFRDLIERYNIPQYAICKYFLSRVAASVGKTLSLRKIFNELKSNSYKLATNFLYELADMAEAAYFFKRISKFDFSLVKREMSDKKAYFIDNGMINAITVLSAGNDGLLFENMVFWELYRKHGNLYTTDIYYYKDASAECDFVLYREGGQPLPVQVSYNINDPDTREREIKGLLKACAGCKANIGWLITPEEQGVLTVDGVTIEMKAAWKWMQEA